MELQVLVKLWQLTGKYPDQVWRGTRGGVDIVLFGTEEMGRVSAAVATMKFLQENPKLAGRYFPAFAFRMPKVSGTRLRYH